MKKMYHQFKCSAIMLPEHRTMLKKQNEEAAQDLTQSSGPDEQQLEEFDRCLKISLENKEEVDLYIKSARKSSLKICGIVKESEPAYSYIGILSGDIYVKVNKEDILKIEKNN